MRINADNFGDHKHSSTLSDYEFEQDKLAAIEAMAEELEPTEYEIGEAISNMSPETSRDYHESIINILRLVNSGLVNVIAFEARNMSAHLTDALQPILEKRARNIIEGKNHE